MKIKLQFNEWMKLTQQAIGNNNIFEVIVNSKKMNWNDIGLEQMKTSFQDLSKLFEVKDKELFFLAVLEHGIVWEHDN